MRALLGCMCMSLSVFGCASSPKTTLIFYLDPPRELVNDGGSPNDGGAPSDFSCIGVAGFDIVVTSGSGDSRSGPLLKDTPVLDPKDCHLTQPFSIHDIDVDSPASVVVTGYDGARTPLVQATGRVDNLHGGATHLQLETLATPLSPVLVVNRQPLLPAGAQLADVTSLTVRAVRMSMMLLNVAAGPYFGVEPGAYAVQMNLGPDGTDDMLALTVDFTIPNMAVRQARLTAHWIPIVIPPATTPSGGYYKAQ